MDNKDSSLYLENYIVIITKNNRFLLIYSICLHMTLVIQALQNNECECIKENNKLPVRPIDVRSKHSHWEQVYVGRR